MPKAEWTRRVKAAAALHGWELKDLSEPVAERGLPLNAAARAGHESDEYGPNHALALTLAELLEVPVAWFEAEDWRPLLSRAPSEDVDDLIRRQAELSEGFDGLSDDVQELLRRIPKSGEGSDGQ